MSTRALFLPVSETPFSPALTLGNNFPHPKERAGSPVTYWHKEMLRPGLRVEDKSTGQVETITPERIQRIAANYAKAKANGFEPPILLGGHGANKFPNAGWVVDVEVKPDGSLWGLHQLIGDEAKGKEIAASYKSSISTIVNYTDEHGNVYDELADHNALVAKPVLSCLKDFVPAIAASRGHAIEAVSFELAAPPEESNMDLTKLRTKVGAAADVTDDKVIEMALAKLDQFPALEQDKLKLSRDLDAANGKVTELSKTTTVKPPVSPSATEMYYLGKSLSLARDAATARAGAKIVTEASKRFLGSETYDLGALTLSREPSEKDADTANGLRKMIDLCELLVHAQPPVTPSKGMNLDRTASLDNPTAGGSTQDDEKIAKDARDEAERWKNDQLAARGIKA